MFNTRQPPEAASSLVLLCNLIPTMTFQSSQLYTPFTLEYTPKEITGVSVCSSLQSALETLTYLRTKQILVVVPLLSFIAVLGLLLAIAVRVWQPIEFGMVLISST